jgi:O-antigen ligase
MTANDNEWRTDRLTDERFRIYVPIGAAFLVGLLVAASVLSWGEVISAAIFAGLLVFLAAFVKPEWALLVVTVLAPLATVTMPMGTLLPGTGLTPMNALALALIIGTFLQRYSPTPPAARATPIDKILLLYVGWSGVSVFVSLARWGFDSQALGEWLAMACGYMMYWVVRRRWNSEKLAYAAVMVVMAMVLYESLIVYRQYSGMDTSAFRWALKDQILGTFLMGNSNDIGCYLSSYCMIGLGLFLSLKNVFWKWMAMGVFIAGAAATFATYSRASGFALAAGLVAITVVKHRRWLVPAIIAVLVVPSILPSSIQGRMDNTEDKSAQGRKELWKHGLYEMTQNPIGLGWRGYSKNEEEAGAMLHDPHNMYVLVGAEQGPIGFILFIGLMVVAGKETLAAVARARTPFARGLGSGIFGMIVAYGLNNIFGSRMVFFTNMQHFFFLLGILIVLTDPKPGEEHLAVEEEPAAKAPKPVSPWRYRSYV